jgi:hypothetical protein
MKSILAFLLFASAAFAADITITDSGQLTKDGVSLNNAGDALLNKLVTVAEFQAVLQAKFADQATMVSAAKAQAEAATALLDKIKAADTKPTPAEKRDAFKALADEARLTSKAKRLAEKAAAKAAIEKEIAEINATP